MIFCFNIVQYKLIINYHSFIIDLIWLLKHQYFEGNLSAKQLLAAYSKYKRAKLRNCYVFEQYLEEIGEPKHCKFKTKAFSFPQALAIKCERLGCCLTKSHGSMDPTEHGHRPKPLAPFCCFPRHAGQEPDWKQSSQESNQHSHGQQAL